MNYLRFFSEYGQGDFQFHFQEIWSTKTNLGCEKLTKLLAWPLPSHYFNLDKIICIRDLQIRIGQDDDSSNCLIAKRPIAKRMMRPLRVCISFENDDTEQALVRHGLDLFED